MHPRIFLDTFWRYDLRNEIFVAMSFEQKYDTRWHNIFRPAIESVVKGNCSFNAVRVDIRKSGDSILTEMMDGIAHSQLVLADISVTDRWSIDGKEHYTRNGNVMYEVGLALACRQPVEVILLRDDNEMLLFDVSHIPVITFDPMNISHSIELIRGCIKDRLKERQLAKDMKIKTIMESLTDDELISIAVNIHLNDPDDLQIYNTFYPVIPEKLIEKGIIRIIRTNINENGRYSWTPFGKVIADLVKSNIPKGTNLLIWKSKK